MILNAVEAARSRVYGPHILSRHRCIAPCFEARSSSWRESGAVDGYKWSTLTGVITANLWFTRRRESKSLMQKEPYAFIGCDTTGHIRGKSKVCLEALLKAKPSIVSAIFSEMYLGGASNPSAINKCTSARYSCRRNNLVCTELCQCEADADTCQNMNSHILDPAVRSI